MAIKVFGTEGSSQGTVWWGLGWAVEHGADIISLSLSFHAEQSPDLAGWRSVCDFLLAAGVLLVCTSGNLGNRLDRFPRPWNIPTPGNVPPPWRIPQGRGPGGPSGAITCGAVDRSNRLMMGPAGSAEGGSGQGPATWEAIAPYRDYPYDGGAAPGLIKPDLCAPGCDLISLAHCNDGFAGLRGTSGSVPHVAGAAALLLSAYPTASPATLREALEAGAIHPTSGPGKDNSYGSGCLHAPGAYRFLRSLGLPRGR